MGIPVELTSFVGRSALFKIEVKNFQGQRFDRSRFETSYRVKRVCTDQSIIEQFKTLQLDNSVGASSSRLLLTPQSTLNPEAVKHEELAKDLLEDFAVVSNEKATQTEESLEGPANQPAMSLESPAIDLAGNTQDIISPKRSPSPENDGVLVLTGRKKKVFPKMRK
ncbi:uncharacterized protein LOC130728748 [Lotus japonicus]|nr:uncharacterized protein LOC130728748 [Lotus japonicus]